MRPAPLHFKQLRTSFVEQLLELYPDGVSPIIKSEYDGGMCGVFEIVHLDFTGHKLPQTMAGPVYEAFASVCTSGYEHTIIEIVKGDDEFHMLDSGHLRSYAPLGGRIPPNHWLDDRVDTEPSTGYHYRRKYSITFQNAFNSAAEVYFSKYDTHYFTDHIAEAKASLSSFPFKHIKVQ
jgi:hypothetical protein